MIRLILMVVTGLITDIAANIRDQDHPVPVLRMGRGSRASDGRGAEEEERVEEDGGRPR